MNSMSSGCAAMASTRALDGVCRLLCRDFGNLHHSSFFNRRVCRLHHAMCRKRIRETRERHLLTALQGVKERLELSQVRVIADVAAVEELHRQFAPRMPIQPRQLLRVK